MDRTGNENYFKNIFYGFRPRVIRRNKPLYLALVAYAIFGISIQIFMPYLIIYYEVSLGMKDYVLIFAPAIILAAVFTFFYGRVYDKKGFGPAVLPSLGLLMIGYVLLFFFKDTALVFIGTVLMLCGYLSGMAVFGAVIRDFTPANKAGMFQGQRIVGQVLIPGIIGPEIGKAVLAGAEMIENSDGTQSFKPNENIFLAALVAAVVLVAFTAAVMGKLKKEKKL